MRLVSVGEDGPAKLEQHEVEGGLEVPGEPGLHQRCPDRPQIVGKADADTGFLARLGLAVLRQVHGPGHGRAADAAGVVSDPGGMAVVVTVVTRSGAVGLGSHLFRHVLGGDQSLDDLERAVLGNGGDAAGDREVFFPVNGAGLDRALDLIEALLDGFGLADQLFGPVIVVELGEGALAGFELLDLGLLLRRALGRLGIDAPIAGGGVPVNLDHGRGPLPAGRELVLEDPEILHGEVGQQRRVVEPDGAVVVVREEIAQHLAARGLVGLDTDEPGDRRGARNPFLGEQPFHLPRGGPVALPRDLFPGGHLAGMVGRDGEGLQHFEVDLVGAVGVEQVRRHVAEAQALLDQAFGRAETRRDGTHGEAGVGQLRERDHLIGRMHGDADDVLRQRQLARHRRIGGDQAGHRMVGVDRALLGQGLHGREAASAGDHGIGAGIGRSVHANDQVLQQAMGGNGGLHLGLGDRVGRRLAHVLGRQRQPGERNLPDERFVQGGDVIHANLPRYRDEKDGTGAAETALSGRPAPRPAPARLRLRAGLLRGMGGGGRAAAARPGVVSREAAGDGGRYQGGQCRSGNSVGESRTGGRVRRPGPELTEYRARPCPAG